MQYPQYFDLDATNGLDVYVWQMAKNSYSFALFSHSETPRDSLSAELLNVRGTNAAEMRQILSTYPVDEEEVTIVLWQNLFSSYLADWQIISQDKSMEEKQNEYGESIRNMLFGEPVEPPSYEAPIYDSLTFDIDADGKDEHCVLGFGPTSGLFTFTFRATEIGADEPEYDNVFHTRWYDLSFVICDDGVVRVQGIDQAEVPQTHLFDITVIDGNIQLTEDGQPINTGHWIAIDSEPKE